jgi:murein DD-endopeptidase MepM/ murein hydrolase activator NlpD
MVPMRRTDAGPRGGVAHRAWGSGAALVCALALTATAQAGAAPVAGAAATGASAALAGGTTATAPDPRARKRQVEAGITEARADLAETDAALARAYDALQATNARIPGARETVDRAAAAAAAADRAHDAAVQALAVARADEAKAQDELTTTSRSLTESRERVAQFAAQMYQEQGLSSLNAAVSSGSPQEFADRVALVGTVMDVQSRSLTRLATARASQTALEDHLSAVRADAAAASERARAALARAAAARDTAAEAKAALDRLAATQSAQAKALDVEAAAERRRLDSLQAESDRLSAVLRARAAAAKRAAAERAAARRAAEQQAAAAAARAAGQRPSRPPVGPRRVVADVVSRSGGVLSAPTGGRISGEFGMRFHPILRYSRLHGGRDYAAPCGTPVRAAADGVVVSAGSGGGFGNRIVLEHGEHRGVVLSSSYNHLSRFAVRGGRVSRGQVIGAIGTTGLSTGCHLHFEVYEDGARVDPRTWL